MTIGIAGANLPALRSHNDAVVLDLMRTSSAIDEGGFSRVEIAARTGLTPQAVSKILGRLREEGVVEEAGRGASTGGKPRTLMRLVRGARYAVGVHIDRDELTVLLADLADPPGMPTVARTVAFNLGAHPEAALARVIEEARATMLGVEGLVLGVGVACPGPLDHKAGVLHRVTHHAEWDGFPLRDVLAQRLGLPVVLDKDTNAAVLAVLGDVRSANCAYLHLGTGLGAGLVLDGTLYRGSRSGAGEFGHQVVQLDGPVCACGSRGCLEALCLAALGARDVVGAAHLLGIGAANLLRLLDIDRVVLGGRAVLAEPERYVREVGAVLSERLQDPARDTVPVTLVPGGARAVADGAAELVLAPATRTSLPGRVGSSPPTA
ncbi:ROK family transcriptional regulator [Wenjunlia tyrosinilytica]|uniref:Transcriptional regulator n=1 Tax=Wenjunlia tyrosinilytica TaxID=1544741 RepID=A0A917ZS65_9ACTN|nr:ROK family transcriptional regulator [Wenjunlia tyrosinilytica]GGO89134.1 transcriptional regulator [Wenjunlia tyrosinilytica]